MERGALDKFCCWDVSQTVKEQYYLWEAETTALVWSWQPNISGNGDKLSQFVDPHEGSGHRSDCNCLRWTQPMPGQEISRSRKRHSPKSPLSSGPIIFTQHGPIFCFKLHCRRGNGKSGKRSLLPYNKNIINNNNRIVSVIHTARQQWWWEMLPLCSSWWIAVRLQACCCLLMWRMLRKEKKKRTGIKLGAQTPQNKVLDSCEI